MDSFVHFLKRKAKTLRAVYLSGLILSLSMTVFAQNSDQTLYLDQNGQATLDIANPDDCFESSVCIPSRAIGDDHAIWLSNTSFPGSSTDFLFESGAAFEQFPDGTATITGIVSNTQNSNDKWEVKLYLSDKKDWNQWSALGRSYKDERGFTGNNYLNWDYYIEDPSKLSKLVGLAGNAGKEVAIEHMPGNYYYGFQVGTAANNKNGDFGLSGWFTYSLDGTNYYQGDFNLDLDCQPREVTYEYSQVNFNCEDLGANQVTITGTDQFGNTCTDDITVTVIDNIAPVINPADVNEATVSLDENGSATISLADLIEDTNKSCDVAKFGGNNSHAVWLSKYTASNANTKFHFDQDGGKLIQFSDGSATIRGTIINPNNVNDSWEVQLNITDKKSWDEWSALGRSWKGNSNTVGNNYLDWDYYIMDTNPANPSQLIGLGDNAGKVKTLEHRPANYNFGFQVGQAANDKDGDFGFSGWFTYQNDQGNYVQGDFNLDLSNCEETFGADNCDVTVTVDPYEFDCDDVGENTVTITVTDASGNSTSTTTTVTVVDDNAPTIITQNATVFLDDNGEASITIPQIDNGSSDDCNLTLSLDKLEFTCDDLGDNIVTLTGTDDSGNTATETATVTVVDNTPPVVFTKNVSVGLNMMGTLIKHLLRYYIETTQYFREEVYGAILFCA